MRHLLDASVLIALGDAYLAALARAHGGRLATLDRALAPLHPDVAVLVDPQRA